MRKSDCCSSDLACFAFILSLFSVFSHLGTRTMSTRRLPPSPPSSAILLLRGERDRRERERERRKNSKTEESSGKKLFEEKLSRPLSFLSLFSPSRSLPLSRAIPLAPRLDMSTHPPLPLPSSEEEERIFSQSLFLPQSNPRCRCALVTRCSATTKAAVRRGSPFSEATLQTSSKAAVMVLSSLLRFSLELERGRVSGRREGRGEERRGEGGVE